MKGVNISFHSVGFILVALFLTSCGGSGTDEPGIETVSHTVSGGGVKGPLANANVSIYAFSSTKPGFKGNLIASGKTDSSAAFSGLDIPSSYDLPYIMEFTSVSGTTDITTGEFPIIPTLRTAITQSLLDSGQQIYATPLTNMAVDFAIVTAGTGATSGQFETALSTAASQVVSTLGFGLDGTVDIFETAPLINEATTSVDKQADVAAYRAAVEAVTAIAYQIGKISANGDTSGVLIELAHDLADGGGIDGSAGTRIDSETLQVLQQDPATLPIPNSATNQTVADVQSILVSETSITQTTTPVTELDTGGSINTVIELAETNPDADGDGVLNIDDAFPYNSSESVDSDGDGIGDNADPDDNNNGILDVDEGQTPAPTASDQDGDDFADDTDNCPSDFNPSQTNTDNDTQGDACDSDDDDDGVPDTLDAFPLNSSESIDTDLDGIGDTSDTDDDNDGVPDSNDTGLSPQDNTTICSVLIDCDGDGVLDGADSDPVNPEVTFNFAPVVVNDSVTLDEDAASVSIAVTENDTDNDGNPYDSVTLVSLESNNSSLGSAVINGNNVDYTPASNANGIDTFTYTVTDGIFTSTGSVSVTIIAIPDAPIIAQSGPLEVTMDEDGSPVAFVAPLITASDVDSTSLSWTGTAATNGVASVSGSGETPVITYIPDENYHGSDTFEAIVSDGTNSSSVSLNITINPQNDLPVVNATGPFSIAEDAANTTLVGTVSASDVDGDITGFSINAGNTGNAFAISSSGQISVAETSVIDFENSTSFNLSIIATDGIENSASQTVTVYITDVNDSAPVVTSAGPFTIAEDITDSSVVGTISATDADTVGSISGYSISEGPFSIDVDGQITVANATAIDYETSSSFNLMVTATDGVNVSASEGVTINITDVNDTAPVIASGQSFEVAATAGIGTVVGTVSASDADTVGVISEFTISGAVFAIDANGKVTVVDNSALGAGSPFTLSVNASDGVNLSTTENITVTVTGNAPPQIFQTGPLSVVMDEDSSPLGFVAPSISATDPEGDILTWSTTGATNGTATVSGTGSSPSVLTYVPDANFNSSDSFEVNVSDGVSTSTITIDVTINPQNDAPTISGIPATTGSVGIAYNFIPGGSDIDAGDTLVYSITGQPSWATTFDTATGELSGTPQPGDEATYNNIVISVTDGKTLVSLPSFDIVISVDTAISMVELLGTENGGKFTWESWSDQIGIEYYSINSLSYDATTQTINIEDAEFNHLTAEFDLTLNKFYDLSLNAGNWITGSEVRVVSTGTGSDGLSMDVTINAATGDELERLRVSAKYIDISGELLTSFLNNQMQSVMFDTNAVFPLNSKAITNFTVESLIDSYHLNFDDDCSDVVVLNGNCNAIYTTKDVSNYATILDQLISSSEWIDPETGELPTENLTVVSNDTENLIVQLVSDGIANFYVVNLDHADPAERVSTPTVGSWVRDSSVQSVDMIRFNIPIVFEAQFPDLLIDDGVGRLLVVQNGYVRSGYFNLTGDETIESQGAINGIANEMILSNFSGVNFTQSISGTTFYDIYLDTNLGYLIDVYDFSPDGVFTLTNYQDGSVEPIGTWDVSTDGILHLTSGPEEWWSKVIGQETSIGVKFGCASGSASGPFNCTVLDLGSKFGVGLSDEASAVTVMNVFNNSLVTGIPVPTTLPLKLDDGSRPLITAALSFNQFDESSLVADVHSVAFDTGEVVSLTFNVDGSGVIEHSSTTINDLTWTLDPTGILRFSETDTSGNQWFWVMGLIETNPDGNVLVQVTTPPGQQEKRDVFLLANYEIQAL